MRLHVADPAPFEFPSRSTSLSRATYTILLSQQAIDDLQWWEEQLPTWNGKKLTEPPATYQFDTDASEKGWGAVYFSPAPATRRIECQGFFTQEMSSNTRELTAVLNAITSLCQTTKRTECLVLVRTDNQVTMSYVNRMGGRKPHLARLAEAIHAFCLERKIRLIVAIQLRIRRRR